MGGTQPAAPDSLGEGFYANLAADTVALDGGLEIELLYDFVPQPGDTFTIVSASSLLSGEFFGLPEGGTVASFDNVNLIVSYAGNAVTLSAQASTGEGEGEGEGEGQVDDPRHTGDQNGDGIVSLSELLRVIQFFNTGGLHCAASPTATEDGFVPGTNAAAQSCTPHASDYNPQDWLISLSELLRLIQFFNSGGYFPCPDAGSEDGFCPGAAPI